MRPDIPTEIDRQVEELLPRLYTTAYYLAPDPNTAEDAVQETIAMFLDSRRRHPSRIRRPAAWCLRVLGRVVRRHRGLPVVATAEDVPCDRPSQEDRAIAREEREIVRDSLRTLPHEEREALSLHVFGGLTYREVAKAVGASRSTVHDRVRRGLGALRSRLERASLLALPLGAQGPEHLISWLRELPPAPIPSSLTAGVTAPSVAVGASSAPQSMGGLVVSALSTKTATVGATALVIATIAGIGIHLHERRAESPAPDGTVAREELDAALREVARLREDRRTLEALLAELEAGAVAAPDPAEPAGAAETASPAPLGAADIDRLLARAFEALRSGDREGFAEALIALLDAGAPAYPAVIELVSETGSYNRIYRVLEGDDADYPFRRRLNARITERRAKLGGLLDALLARPEALDGASLFAFDLMRHSDVESARSREEHVGAIAAILESAIRSEEGPVDWNTHAVQAAFALGRLRAAEALGTIRDLLLDPTVSRRNKSALAQAAASIGGEEAVGVLTEARDQASASLRRHLLRNIERVGGPEIDRFLEESVALESDPGARAGLLRTLAGRTGPREELVARLDRGELAPQERRALLESLIERGDESDLEKAWEHFDGLDRETQDDMVAVLAGRDPRATGILFDRLAAGEISDELATGLTRLDSGTVRRRADALRGVAADTAAAPSLRGAAATALARVDRPGAVDALLAGLQAVPAAGRRTILSYLVETIGGPEASAAVAEAARSDPDEGVREHARRMVGKR